MIHNWETEKICMSIKVPRGQQCSHPTYTHKITSDPNIHTERHAQLYKIQYQGVSLYNWDLILSCVCYFFLAVSSKVAFTNVIIVPIISKSLGAVTWFLQDKQDVFNCCPSGCRKEEIIWYSYTHIISDTHTNTLPLCAILCCTLTNAHLDADALPNKTSGLFRLPWNENYQTENSFRMKTHAGSASTAYVQNWRCHCSLSLFNVCHSWTFLNCLYHCLHFCFFTFCCTAGDYCKRDVRLLFQWLQGTCGMSIYFVHVICTPQNTAVTWQVPPSWILQERLKRTLNLNILTESNSLCIQATVTV